MKGKLLTLSKILELYMRILSLQMLVFIPLLIDYGVYGILFPNPFIWSIDG